MVDVPTAVNDPHSARSHRGSRFPLPLEGRTTSAGCSGMVGTEESKVGNDMPVMSYSRSRSSLVGARQAPPNSRSDARPRSEGPGAQKDQVEERIGKQNILSSLKTVTFTLFWWQQVCRARSGNQTPEIRLKVDA